jgi:hypothetical protein
MRGRIVTAVAVILAAAALFVLFLSVSRTYPENSDEANILLMAWDMLHGHVTLHGWDVSDVSFYTTELPQYTLLESFLGLHADTAHVAAAMTYTLVILVAAVLARGKATTRTTEQANASTLLTAGIMIAPQLGIGVFILLLSVGHIGTAVPLMLTLLVIDRGTGRAREAVWVAVLLAWALMADPLVLVDGIVPLAAVCLWRIVRFFPRLPRQVGSLATFGALRRARAREIGLVLAAGAGYGLATLAYDILRASGSYWVHNVDYTLAPAHLWPGYLWTAMQGWLALFGAKTSLGQNPVQFAFAILHWVGVLLVAYAMWRVARRFLRYPALIDQVMLLAIVLNFVLYVVSTLAYATDINAREFAIALPYGAVLAGRVLGPRLAAMLPGQAASALGKLSARRLRLVVPALAAVAAAYGAGLGYAAAQPAVPPTGTVLAQWLSARHLTYGLSGYWQSSIVTVQTGGAVTIRAVYPNSLTRYQWESQQSWFTAARYNATFLVSDSQPGAFSWFEPTTAMVARLGKPASTYTLGPYTIEVWNKNLLADP